jgi:hypothetical protein
MTALSFVVLAASPGRAADEPDLIFKRSTVFKWLTPTLRKRGKSRGGQGERALARMIWGSGGMTWLPGTANRAPR